MDKIQDKIQIDGRSYSVTSSPPTDEYPEAGTIYTLNGARGAVYRTMRNQKNKNLMFLVNKKSMSVLKVWLTDEGGVLRQVQP